MEKRAKTAKLMSKKRFTLSDGFCILRAGTLAGVLEVLLICGSVFVEALSMGSLCDALVCSFP